MAQYHAKQYHQIRFTLHECTQSTTVLLGANCEMGTSNIIKAAMNKEFLFQRNQNPLR